MSELFLAAVPRDLPSVVLARAAAVLENAVLQRIEGRRVQTLGLTPLARECVAVPEQTVISARGRGHPVLVVGVGGARGLPAMTRALVQVVKVRAQQKSVHLRIALLAAVEEEVRIQSAGLGDDALEVKGLLFVGSECALGECEPFVPSVTASDTCQCAWFMNERNLHE